MLLLDKGNIFA